MEPWSELATIAEVEGLLEMAMAKHGGLAGPGNLDCLDRSFGAAYSAECYNAGDPPTPGLVFAAGLLYFLCKNHCFTDGNKRLSWVAMMTVLHGLHLTLVVSDDDAEAFVLSIATPDGRDFEDVIAWVAQHLAAVEPTDR